MTTASRFLFERDFREPAAGRAPGSAAEIRAAEERGFARGVAEGRRLAAADADAVRARALEGIAGATAALLGRLDADRAEIEAEAVAFAVALGRKIAGEALSARPLAPIAETAAAAFQHLRGVPHLVVRVNDALVEAVEPLLRRLAHERGFEGRIVVLGEPEVGRHDVRLEWAEGGIVREQARIEDAALETLSAGAGAGRDDKDRLT